VCFAIFHTGPLLSSRQLSAPFEIVGGETKCCLFRENNEMDQQFNAYVCVSAFQRAECIIIIIIIIIRGRSTRTFVGKQEQSTAHLCICIPE